ncbi:heme-binding protein 2 isoform X1 [Peromyscus californicus insignis]|uniref:heme-binding protein 2 isoform X1 n=1 Tax=Peromyscus californicus insignis TaxID=564181 RepID=UPI0022A7E507|nr:heme-binding protein 2 isoform X1 [Peromyscus californicus insignis]
MAEEPEPDLEAAEDAVEPAVDAAEPVVEMPSWKAPEDTDPQPGSYEIRHYGPAKWVSTCVESMDWDSAIQTGFTKLNGYIQGKNEKEMKLKLTAPVTSCVEAGSSPFSESTITISLRVPSEQQSDPPRPAESDVFIEDRAGMTVFVRLRRTFVYKQWDLSGMSSDSQDTSYRVQCIACGRRLRRVFILPWKMYVKGHQGFCIGSLVMLWPVRFDFQILSHVVNGNPQQLRKLV